MPRGKFEDNCPMMKRGRYSSLPITHHNLLTVGRDTVGFDVKFFGTTTGKYFLWDESADGIVLLGGLTMTGALGLTGNTQLTGTLTLGVDDTGHDLKAFGATSGKYLLWDESADKLIILGDYDITGASQFTGTLTVGVNGTGHDVKFFGDTAGQYFLWDESADGIDLNGAIDADYAGTATRAYDFQTTVTNAMTSAVDKQFMYIRADLDGAWSEDVSGGDGYTVAMIRGYVGASAGGIIAEGLRAGMNLDAGVIVSDPAGAGYIAGARITTYVPATANAKCNKGLIVAPRDDTAVAAIAGSQYIGAQLYLKQAVAKQESWGLDIYTESGCANLDAAINIRNGGSEKYAYCIDMNGASLPTADFRLNLGATLLNSAAGSLDLALGTIAGAAADDGLAITVTDSAAFTNGYANMVHLIATNSGAKTGNASLSQWNGFAADLTVAAAANVNGGYVYIAKSGTPDLSAKAVAGFNLDVQEVGATDYLTALWLQKSNTTKGTSVDSFILMSNQGSGVGRTGLHFQGIALPDTFLTIPAGPRDMLTTTTYTGTTKRYLKVNLNGEDYAIALLSLA